jgi:tetratricopeptide (TPR) repeat protein
VGAAVERWLAERGQPAAVAGDGASPASSDPAGAADDGLPATVEGVVALLSDPSLSEDERQEIWQKLRDAKRLDAVVEWFEENAAEHASSPDAQVQVGEAYVAKIIEAGNGPLAGTWALKADAAWDRALELDPAHWDARFAKAIGLSFWPPIFGKQPEAIRQFETLLGYQEQAQLEPDHEQTYILLGNLYVQAGRTDDAQALWKKGLALFPQSAELAAKVQ